MIVYLFFLILTFLPLIEGELLGIGRFLLLASCLPLTIYIGKRKIIKDKTFNFFIIFLFFTLLSTIFSPVFSRSLNMLLLYFAFFIYFLTARVLAKEKRSLFKDLLIVSIIFLSLVLCFLSFYLLFSKEPPPFSTMNLIFASFGHNHLIDFLIFSYPLSLVLLFKEKQRFKKILFLLLNLIFILGFIFSFSRGGLLIAILIIVLFEFGLWKKRKQQNKPIHTHYLYSLGMGLLLILILGLGIIGYYYLGEEKNKNLNNPLLKKALRQPPFSSRVEYWRQAALAFKEKPLLGWGLDNFRYLSKKYQKQPSTWSWYVHNHFFQMFVETGIFGGLSFLLLIAFILKHIFSKQWYQKIYPSVDWALSLGLLVSAIHSFFDYDWQFSSVFLFFWVIAGYVNRPKVKSAKDYLVSKFTLYLGIILFAVAVFEFTGNLFLFSAARNEKSNNYQKAEIYYQKSISLWPFKLENWQLVIHYYKVQNQKEKALNLLNNLLTLEPINDRNYKLMGDLFYEKKNLDKAVKYYQKASELNLADSEDVYLKLVDIWLEKGEKNWQELFQILTKIEEIKGKKCLLKCLGSENEEKILNLLLQLIKSDDFSQLNEDQQARVYFWLTVLTTYQKDWDQDIKFLKKAVILDDRQEYNQFLNDLFLIKKIEESFWNKDFDEVEQLTKIFIDKEKDHIFHQKFYLAEAIYFLGEIKLEKGRLREAEDYFKRSIKVNPWNDKPYLSLANIYENKNEKEKAKEILNECIKTNSWSKDCKERL